jgi:hypothetical protein
MSVGSYECNGHAKLGETDEFRSNRHALLNAFRLRDVDQLGREAFTNYMNQAVAAGRNVDDAGVERGDVHALAVRIVG